VRQSRLLDRPHRKAPKLIKWLFGALLLVTVDEERR
jgi:hypothetical protein